MNARPTHPLRAWRETQRICDQRTGEHRAMGIAEAAATLGVPYQTWAAWERYGDEPRARVPSPGYMVELVRMTKGQVRPDHFYDLPALRAEMAGAVQAPESDVADKAA